METVTPQVVDIDKLALQVFLKSLEIAGGPRKLIEHRHLTWVPALIEAAYAVVLSKEAHKTAEDIAQFLGLTVPSVRNILRADPEQVQHKLQHELAGEPRERDIGTHIAGGLALLAYDRLKQGDHAIAYLQDVYEQCAEILGIAWPAEVLRRVKGLDFPVSRDAVADRLRDVHIGHRAVSELLPRLPETITSPSSLLSHLKAAVQAEERP